MERAFRFAMLGLVLTMVALWVLVVGRVGRPHYLIQYMIWDDNRGVIRQIVDEWNDAHPAEGVQLVVTPWDGYWDKLFATMVGKQPPDVFWLSPEYREPYIEKGQLLDLSPYIERDGFSLDDFQPRELVMNWMMDGKVHGINRDFDTIGLFYNKKLFDEAGIPYPDETWDWDRLLEAALRFKRHFQATGQPEKWPLDIPAWAQGGWLNLVWQNGGEVLGADKQSLTLDRPEAVQALQWQADLVFKHGVSPRGGPGTIGGLELFRAGNLAMTYNGSWTCRQVAATEDLDWDVAVLPKGKRRAVVTNGLAECVARRTRHPEACWRFVQYLVSQECQERLPVIASRKTATGAWVPSNADEREADGKKAQRIIPEHGQAFIDMLQYARAKPITHDVLEWNDILDNYIGMVLISGSLDAAEAMRRAAAEVNPILQRRP